MGTETGAGASVRFAVLGPVRAWRDGEEIGLGPAQQRLLLALLVAHAGRPVTMDELVDTLWGESPPVSPANAVYRHIGVLRRLLEPGLAVRAPGSLLIRDAGGYRLDAEPDAVDLARFRGLLRRARAAVRDAVGTAGRGTAGQGTAGQGTAGQGAAVREVALPLFLEALALRTGPVATGVPLEARFHPVFTALEREYLTAVKEAADAALAGGAAGHLLTVLHRTACDHPLDEQLQARLVRALAATGQRAEALDAWQRVRARLDTELGITPGAELRAAQAEALRDDTSTPASSPTPTPTSSSRARTSGTGAPLDAAPPSRSGGASSWSPPGRPAAGPASPGGPAGRTPARAPAQLPGQIPGQRSASDGPSGRSGPTSPAAHGCRAGAYEARDRTRGAGPARGGPAAVRPGSMDREDRADREGRRPGADVRTLRIAAPGLPVPQSPTALTTPTTPTAPATPTGLSLVPAPLPVAVPAPAPAPAPARDRQPGSKDAGPFVRPAQLPADLCTFAGRRAELAQVVDLSADSAPATRIAVISGMGGIGKTTLAVRWAHRIAHRFPDGQLYVNLRGFDPGGTTKDPGEAVRGFLEALGVPPQRMPAGTVAQAGLYRSLLAGRRVLILLDNARDADQVRPLLPGSAGCLVVVTSRDRLFGLVTVEAARPLALAQLQPPEARESLARRLGADRVSAEPCAVDEIIARCAGLPLALAVVATRAAAHPGFPLTSIAAELREAHGSLDAFTDPDPTSDVRAVFSWSYRALSPGAARLLRLLSLHPGPDVALPGAAATAGATPAQVRPLLTELTRAHLLTEQAPGRYTCHDLLRTYAMERSEAEDGAADRDAAVHRLLDHYLHTAHAAGRRFSPSWTTSPLDEARPGAGAVDFADDGAALGWYTTERRVLGEVVALAGRLGFDGHVWRFAWTLERFFDRQGHWHESAATQRAGLDAAVREGHRTAQAHLHRGLARAGARLERYDDAQAHIRLSLDLFADLGDRLGLAHAHRSHGWLLDRLGRHDEALEAAGRALRLYRDLGERIPETSALHALGWTHVLLGDHHRAAVLFEAALAELAGHGDHRYAEAGAWDSLGVARHHLGEHERAVAALQCALGLYREVGDTFNEAGTLRHLGDTYLSTGDTGAARTVWERAVALFARTDPTAADEIRTMLCALGDAGPAPRIAAVPATDAPHATDEEAGSG
ncbi:tetratricopeptide repeat protein [Streptomyces sp. NBC_01485]|uniref:AfsR/SARP family transcriptional regulator n=1 Tax=Streptomyces sp. NBC_01485 TaxID=2903884 RepID=UPI002E354CDB|nr:BTAD domain-containing putative transcriptional regulator [Streptomyces sp. NBC_01485]